MSSLFARFFPLPTFFTLPTVGLDFSDTSMRIIKLRESRSSLLPSKYAEVKLPENCLAAGRIIDQQKLNIFLKKNAQKFGLKYVRFAISESQVYSFIIPIDKMAKENIRGAIEFVLEDNIPLKVEETVFDYHKISENEKNIMVQVVAMSSVVANQYLEAFSYAEIVPVSFELDGQATARAILSPDDKGSSMIVDIGSMHTAIAIVNKGTVVYTSTIDFGSRNIVDSISKFFSSNIEESRNFLLKKGLEQLSDNKDLFLALTHSIDILKNEINKRIAYWHDRKDLSSNSISIEMVYMCGLFSLIPGLDDYLSAQLRLKVVQSNPWRNCLDFDKDIPSIAFDQSQSYVTAIGLVLADYIHD